MSFETLNFQKVNRLGWVYPRFHNSATAWIILTLSILLTASAWYIAGSLAQERANERFNFAVVDAHERIQRRVSDYEQILKGGVAFFNASTEITREDWRVYVRDLQIDKHFPGLQGMGYSLVYSPEEKEELETRVRLEGFPGFHIHPVGREDPLTTILYLEPFEEDIQPALGYDMFAEENRRAAMEYAYLTGYPGLSGKVNQVQDTEDNAEPGFLMYLPVYENPFVPLTSVHERRTRLMGFVFSAIQMEGFMPGVLGSSIPEVSFAIYDGANIEAKKLLYQSTDDVTDVDAHALYQSIKMMPLGGREWTILYRSTKHFETVVFTSQPTLIGIGGIAVDLLLFLVILSLAQNRKLIEKRSEEIEDSQKLYKGIIEGCPDGFCILDREGRLLEVNPAYCQLSGYSTEELVGRKATILDAALSGSEIEEQKNEVIAKGWKKFRTEHRRKDGSTWPVEIMSSYWPHQDGRFFSFCRDITHRIQTEDSLIEAKQNAEAANRAKSEFLANMSHEIRTPMNAIMGLTQLAMEMDLPTEARDYMSKSIHGSKALLGLLNDILDYSKIEAHRMELSPDWMRLDELLLQVKNLYKVQAEQTGMKIETSMGEDVPKRIFVDALKLNQILNNLVGNALKFSSRGTVRISVEVGEQKDESMELRFAISDQGIGMTEDQMKLLFKPFTQGDSSITRSFGGTGLGLTICKSLVDLMGGSISVESEMGEGSVFRFTIVVKYDPESHLLELDPSNLTTNFNPQHGEFARDALKGMQVLVGEDIKTNQVIAIKLLERRGAKVSVACNGAEVIDWLDRKDFDVILLDLQMPVMGGLECVARIRSTDASYQDIPILAMTAAVSREDRDSCSRVGMNGFVGKPFERDQLLAEILRVTNCQRVGSREG